MSPRLVSVDTGLWDVSVGRVVDGNGPTGSTTLKELVNRCWAGLAPGPFSLPQPVEVFLDWSK